MKMLVIQEVLLVWLFYTSSNNPGLLEEDIYVRCFRVLLYMTLKVGLTEVNELTRRPEKKKGSNRPTERWRNSRKEINRWNERKAKNGGQEREKCQVAR